MFKWYIQAYFSTVMARGLSLVCDALVTATVCDVIDEDEFVHLFLCLLSSLLVLDIPQIILT